MPLVVKNGEIVTVAGALATDVACCCDGPDECPCIFPTDWRITDAAGNVYAQGEIVTAFGPGCETIVPSLEDFPNPFTPLFYWNTGALELKLEVLGCDGENWTTLDSWSPTIDLCDGGRFPLQSLDGPWPPPAQCACKNQQKVDDGIEECDPCPDLVTGAIGDGQAWRDPQPGVGETFTGAIDGEWTNLMNWEDANGLSPAGSLPGTGTNVSIEANVTSAAVAIDVAELTIAAGVEFSVSAYASDLHVYGAIERNALCPGEFGHVTASGEAFVYGGGRNNGEIVNAVVKFSGDGLNDTQGVVTGNARFDDTSRNDGTIANIPGFSGMGNAEFYDTAENRGTVEGDGEFYDDAKNGQAGAASSATVGRHATFNERSQNLGSVTLDAVFNGESQNIVGTVEGNATFNSTAQNIDGVVEGNAVFNGQTINDGAVNGDANFYGDSWNGYEDTYAPPGGGHSVGGTATFYDYSHNAEVVVNAVFNDSSVNTVSPSGDTGSVTNATFNHSSQNERGAFTVNATFNGTSINDGNVTTSATFNGSSQNTADDPSNGQVVMCNATFGGTSSNAGVVDAAATFNSSAINAAAGVVSTDATFNADSINRGAVTGTATFNGCSYNDGGTAGTFVPNPPPSAYPC